MKRKIIKIFMFAILIGAIILLFKVNVTFTKEVNNPEIEESTRITMLDINSDLVLNLYSKLNIDLINNNCSKDTTCLYNSNYKFLYFNKEDDNLLEEEMLYLVFNELYKENNFTVSDDKIIFDKKIVKEKIQELFIVNEFQNLGSSFKISECGIIDYTYTGEVFELKLNTCEDALQEIGFTKIIDAYKEENTIKINVISFYAKTKKKEYEPEDNVFKIYNYFDEEALGETSYNNLVKFNLEFFDNYNFNKYTFIFELLEDDYHLSKVLSNVKNV